MPGENVSSFECERTRDTRKIPEASQQVRQTRGSEYKLEELLLTPNPVSLLLYSIS